MATITLERRADAWVNVLAKYKVLIDGQEVARIGPGERWSFDVPPGVHDVMLRMDWVRSKPLRLELADDEEAELFCEPNAAPGKVLYFMTLGRKKYIGLRHS